MCNTTCNNHSYGYNTDIIPENALVYYVMDDECECCKCKQTPCEEPKKVSCRSLACQQLNDECSCKRKKKVRKTTMVNVLENNVIRLEDKMNNGCASMHESIEEITNNMNVVYNALKDEEARAKLQEAFLHYGLDDAVTRAEYNPEDRKIHFYHKNPSNCLNVNVHEGCDCDCCNACGCECKCNNDECQSDIPYTMDEDCNIVPMSREEEELPFTIDCTDFLRDIFVSSAYLEEGLVDPEGDTTHQFLVIEFTRWLEPDIEHDDDQSVTPHTIRIDLTELWKLDNYYDKWKIDEIVAAIYLKIAEEVATLNNRITNEVNTLNNKIDSTKSELNQTINNTKNELNQSITNTKNEIDNSINNTKQELQLIINGIDTDVNVENLDVVVPLGSNTPTAIAKVKGQDITIKVASPEQAPVDVTVDDKNATLTPGTNNIVLATIDGKNVTANVPASASIDVTANNPTLLYGTQSTVATVNGTPITVTMPAAPEVPEGGLTYAITNVQINQAGDTITVTPSSGDSWDIPLPEPGEGADGNDYVISGVVENNVLTLTRKDGGTVPINLPEQPRYITNITQEGNTVTFTWSSGDPTTINVGGECLWEEYSDGVIPKNGKKTYSPGFYDTTVS